jgi:dTDP-4-dehydrorhamnose 3,5-epimerase-like enzyme
MAICLAGTCRFVMDNGIKKEEFVLSKFNQAILIDPMIWHEMHDFSKNCVLLVLADDFYDEKDYIRDYSIFLKSINR